MDLDAYFARIGYTGARTATLDVLRALHVAHPRAIPFENLSPRLGWPVSLAPDSLERKLVQQRRGGYCFEHNLLFQRVLEAIGFTVTGLSARVMWRVPPGVTPPRSHMALLVELPEGPYLADVGFGGLTMTGPLRLEANLEQETPHEPFRLARGGPPTGCGEGTSGVFVLEARIVDDWRPLYQFSLEPQLPVDYEAANWYTSTYPQSIFVNLLIAARPDPDRRFALLNNRLSIHHLDGAREEIVFTTAGALRDTLEHVFQIALPDDPAVEALLDVLVSDQ